MASDKGGIMFTTCTRTRQEKAITKPRIFQVSIISKRVGVIRGDLQCCEKEGGSSPRSV